MGYFVKTPTKKKKKKKKKEKKSEKKKKMESLSVEKKNCLLYISKLLEFLPVAQKKVKFPAIISVYLFFPETFLYNQYVYWCQIYAFVGFFSFFFFYLNSHLFVYVRHLVITEQIDKLILIFSSAFFQ